MERQKGCMGKSERWRALRLRDQNVSGNIYGDENNCRLEGIQVPMKCNTAIAGAVEAPNSGCIRSVSMAPVTTSTICQLCPWN